MKLINFTIHLLSMPSRTAGKESHTYIYKLMKEEYLVSMRRPFKLDKVFENIYSKKKFKKKDKAVPATCNGST
jgi:hypothetical protein